MLEGLVAWVLNNYLGKYVENLNTDQLSVALLSGKVELENLPLKKDALRYLGLPIEIKAGFIGKVQLHVPVRQIRSAPWVIAIEKLYLVATPVNLDEWDSAVEATIAHERKMALLDALEAQWRAEHEANDAGYYATSYSSWLSYGTGLLANIVENLQLKLNDVHIRYEDALTCPGRAFACGLAVESLAAESCDAGWRRGFTPLDDPCSFKLLELNNLALYWDPMPVPAGMMADCTLAELTERMRATWSGAHRYMLAPTTASARVRRERCELPLRDRNRPRLACHLTLDSVQMRLTSRQYSELAGCARGLERVARLRELRALRPERGVRGHARDWWRYAVRAHLPHHTWLEARPTWAQCAGRARLVREYVDTCLQVLSQPAATLPPERQAAKDDFEWRTPLHVLKALREVAIRKVPVSTPVSTPEQSSSGRSVLVRWFPQWWGWYAAPPPNEPRPPSPTTLNAPTASAATDATATSRLEDEILDVIADSLDDNTLLRRDALFGLFEFTLSKGSLDLCTDADENASSAEGEGLELQFSTVCVRVESRPRAGAHALHVSLGGVCLRDRVTPRTLFPVLVAPQGLIRDGLSAAGRRDPHYAPQPPPASDEPLFELTYEKRPAGVNCDYKLRVRSSSLEVVWCAAAARWARLWAAAGAGAGAIAHVRLHTRATLHHHWDRLLHHTRRPTERRSWQVELDISAPQILFVEDLCDRDASVLVVDFGRLKLANASLPEDTSTSTLKQQSLDDDEEMFMTPCSTPPGSLLSPASPPASPPPPPALHQHLRTSLYDRYKIELSDLQILVGRARDNWKYAHTKTTSALHLLDRFSISLQAERRVVATSEPQYPRLALCGSLPALVAHLSEHKLSAVRAVLASATRAHHACEPDASPNQEGIQEEEEEDGNDNSETEFSDFSLNQNATLLMLQFAIDQMSLEVQSRGRSIAEVQVCGVRAALGVRAADTSLALSVHSLLLVDALQTYGPDFELLVASHRHVGMDTASGSIRGSEPTSPTSPASPDARSPLPPPTPLALHRALYSLHHATNNAEPGRTSPSPSWPTGQSWNTSYTYGTAGSTWGTSSSAWGPGGTGWGAEGASWGNTNGWGAPGLVDSEALIAVELCFVKGEGDSEDLRIANILFNNLDVIANQETIVELIGFAHRVCGAPPRAPPAPPAARAPPAPPANVVRQRRVRTEITFDFHRLGVLLLRAGVRDGAVVASKIATATVGDARIQATLVDGDRIEVGGSLGGVQVVSLSERAGVHTRVLSAGRAPAVPAHHAHHVHRPPRPPSHSNSDEKALLFSISRTIRPATPQDSKVCTGGAVEEAEVVEVQVSVRVASVWYTHSGPLLRELQSCVAEFQQYLANLARSIRAAAADMAIGLVHPRGDTLYANPRLSQSVEGVSPRRRTTSVGCSLDEPDRDSRQISLSVSVELESPVVVVPRAARSAQVFVAHLGRMSLANRPGAPSDTMYRVRVRDISLVSLDVSDKLRKRNMSTVTDNLADIYDVSCGLPVLHDTALQLTVTFCELDDGPRCTVDGKVVDGLHVTASREQYEQLLETLQWLGDSADATDGASPAAPPPPPHEVPLVCLLYIWPILKIIYWNEVLLRDLQPFSTAHYSKSNLIILCNKGRSLVLNDITCTTQTSSMVEPAVPTLRLDPQLRAAVLAVPPPSPPPAAPHTPLVVTFELSTFTVELRADVGAGERSLVALTFREFSLRRDRLHPHESTLQVSLHSITMEDLTKDPESKHRMLMVSHTPPVPPKAVFVSKSCPDFVTAFPHEPSSSLRKRPLFSSLPAELNVAERLADREYKRSKEEEKQERHCPTPPSSPERGAGIPGVLVGPAHDNLVWVSVHTRHPAHPHFHDVYKKVAKVTKVEFNCLKLVLSIDSWVAVLDFFGIAGEESEHQPPAAESNQSNSTSENVSETVSTDAGATETEMNVRSLSVVVVGARGDACRALVSRVRVRVRDEARAAARDVRATLGALALADLAPRAGLWRERLRMRTAHALDVHYRRLSAAEAAASGYETSLSLEMGPVTYVHTRRFVLELQAFARDFSLLRRVIAQARQKVTSSSRDATQLQRMHLRVRCEAPVIVLPVSGRSRSALAAELQLLLIDNRFRRAGDPDTVSKLVDPTIAEREVLDVRSVRAEGLSLWCARAAGGAGERCVRRRGAPLLPAPTALALQLERNCCASHNVPELTVQGRLATLRLSLDAAQYRLVRGVLAHNLAEPCDELLPQAAAPPAPAPVWRTWSLQLDLQDVCVELRGPRNAPPLACINFIKSRLVLEAYSDLAQDIDLVSQEILVSDTRYAAEPANRRGNVFSHIVQPMPDHRHSVQAEVHARKRQDSSAYTILINNMRLMAILDWWEAANQFIMQPPPPAADPDLQHLEDAADGAEGAAPPAAEGAVELKLNITDSQLVLVEDASLWDTNAVILKSTTVITYRPADAARPVLCELNELEVYSCVLGLEEETALSIVEPAALHAALRSDAVLHIAMGTLNLRLSYHDMRMFASMLQSLPAQARAALSGKSPEESGGAPANSVHMRSAAERVCAARPRWPRAAPAARAPAPAPPSFWPLRAVQVDAECVTLCVIDDCLDSDVPLLEVSLNELHVEQDLRKVEDSFEDPLLVSTPSSGAGTVVVAGESGGRVGAGGGRLRAQLSADYYNRILSGWEPVIEPWRFESRWEYTLSSGLSLARVQLDVRSADALDTNLTSALVDLVRLVRTNWTTDYYAPQTATSEQSPKSSPAGHRRRSPFVPYALRNLTGQRLWFTTLTTASDEVRECGAGERRGPDDSWVCVRAGDTEPFSFGARRGRARDAPHAPAPLHRLVLSVDGWAPPDPVCVDRVGVFFRHISHAKSGTEARLVLEVSLEGSARKLVTVRSALQLINKLPHPVELRLDRAPAASSGPWSGGGARSAQVAAGARWAVPLAARAGAVWARPLVRAQTAPAPVLAPAAVDWRAAASTAERALLHIECRAPHDYVYRFCCAIVRERFPPDRGELLAGHTLTLVPALRLENLLPLELQYRADHVSGTLAPAGTQPFHQVNVEDGVELSVKLEGFAWSTALSVGGAVSAGSFSARLKLRDLRGRRLYLNARVTVKKTDGIKVSVSAAYWLVNRTGLPLVFRAEGGGEAAGQFAEHELARMVAPLPFAFADGDGPTVSARLGSGLAASAEWCSPFGLGPGVTVKRLESRGGEGERSFAVGVSVRSGRGRYRRTNIVTLTPRYQLHNNTPHCLQFAQKCTATTLNDPGAIATHVSAVAGCYLPWHWARWDREQLLCVRVLAEPAPQPARTRALTAWSGGFRIDAARSLHVACRESGGSYQLLRVEVVAQGAALLVVLSATRAEPPPLRIDNFSPVAIMFHQVGCTEECVVGAGARARWALPEPEGASALALRAPGGPRLALPLGALHADHTLLYQNFIYVAFAATAAGAGLAGDSAQEGGAGEDEGVLVLEVPLGSTRVQLARKRYGDRSQLWRRGPGSQLLHEGSSPPQPTDALSDDCTLSPHAMVLDIEEAAPRPGRAAALVLRRADPRRASTQAWRLVPAARAARAARMACAHANLCVQPEGGLLGLVPEFNSTHVKLPKKLNCFGTENVLKLPSNKTETNPCRPECRVTCAVVCAGGRVVLGLSGPWTAPVPAEHALQWRTLRPGSGRLTVTLDADGPTRLVRIRDQADPERASVEASSREEESSREWGLSVSLASVSLSLVARWPPAELLFAQFTRVRLTAARAPSSAHLALSVDSMQWDNQLTSTPSPVLLHCLDDGASVPALHVSMELTSAPPHYNAVYFTHLIVALRPVAVRLDERLILLVWSWVEGGGEAPEGVEVAEEPDEAEYETRRVLHELTALHATRYYFALIKIIPSQIRLSMFTANKLEGELSALKRRLGLTFIRFEDAAVELEPFVRAHAFDSAAGLARQLLRHFKDELKWQAAKILGSVDFLGNPLGFVADVSEGVSGLLLEGNVGALLKNVTHGISNSAAKVTETLGDGLERVVGDEAHEETRRRIRSAAAGAHLAAGFRGLGLGILGGMTSLVKHSYEGAAAEGMAGFLAGVGKGLVGTVTKPVIGVLDLAAETAAALRETSRRAGGAPRRARAPRLAAGGAGGAGGAAPLPRYCPALAEGAALLLALPAREPDERFLAYRTVRDTPHDIRALLSDTYLRIVTCKHGQPQVVMETHLSNLVSCTAVLAEGAWLVELGVRGAGAGEALRRPRVQCDSAELAGWLARHAAAARQLHHDRRHTLLPHADL
ncbi:intermembrane lipid transfer protein Vps13D [Nymphalis io]|uniref:intermembrane lipid transfer protein Vps13D n=1 Tax=Inachis io TaxID=171585 RepID=UPI002167339D|nr:intermembrane lipid transfer protein Vps13D [Nymphalis io]